MPFNVDLYIYVKSQHSLFCEKRLIYVWFYRGSGKARASLPLVSFVCNIPQTYFVLYRLLFLQKNKRRGRTEDTYTALLLQENWAAKKERLFRWPIGLHSSVVQVSKASSDILRRKHEQKHLLSISLNNWSQEYSSSLMLGFLSSKILKVSFIWNESNANLKTIVN